MPLNQRIQAILLGALIATTHTCVARRRTSSDSPADGASPKSTTTGGEHGASGPHISQAGSGAAGFLLAQPTDSKLNQSNGVDALLAELLARVGPDMRPMRDFGDFPNITPEVTKRAWLLMHEHARLAVADRMQFMAPIVNAILGQANVSERCSRAARSTLEAAEQLDSWAIQLLSAWGNFPPTGFFEGTFGDIGSYHGCLNVPQNAAIGHAHYCTISYRPLLTARPNYELIIRGEPEELLRLFERGRQPGERDAFSDALAGAQYYHYVYFKLGTCFPIDCGPLDVQKLAKLIGRRSILMSGPVKCHSKYEQDYLAPSDGSSRQLQISTRDLNDGVYIWKPHMTHAQVVALTIVALISFFIVLATAIDALTKLLAMRCEPPVRNPSESAQTVHRRSKQVETQNLAGLEMKLNESTQFDPNNNSTVCSLYETNETKSNETEDEATGEGRASGSGQISATEHRQSESLFRSLVEDFSIVNNVRQFLKVSRTKNEIDCINGIRCITMSWIVTTHTMQYNDWSAFARTRQVEPLLQSLVNQPLFNGSYLVDSFFLVSGLLTSYSTFGKSFQQHSTAAAAAPDDMPSARHRKAQQRQQMLADFSSVNYLVGRYLRLTPQIIFVSLLFILLPLMTDSGGPHWYTITGEYSENCSQNWWVNFFYIQAFYRTNEMCNFVGWWISVDMFYHLFALAIILLILRRGHRMAPLSCAIMTLAHGAVQAKRHYQLGLPPNLLSTIPQTGAMWSQMTLEFFWTPHAHALPYFFGFYLGHLMARDSSRLAAWFSAKRARLGWSLALVSLALQSYSTYFWVIGRWRYTPLQSTVFHLISAAVWSLCLAWIIVACHFGHGGLINRLLSCKLFAVLGKASYVVYLSHFLVLFTFFGGQNLLLEPTRLTMLYVIVGNVFFAMLLGSVLSAVYETPWLKTQRRIMRHIR